MLGEQAGDAVLSPLQTTPCTGQFFVPSADLRWKPALTHKMQESEPMEPEHEKLEKIREEVLKRKLEMQLSGADRVINNGSPSSVTPKVGVNFAANKNDGWSPLDNTIAISNKGMVVSVANDTFEVFDSTGVSKYSNTLNTFINDNTIANACDPVIVYDQGADRFIFYCQEVTNTQNAPNHMLVFFSKTNNPATGGWNYFKLTGNPLNDGSMSDYPKVGITDNDVFISSNLFKSGSYNQSFVLQIQKSTGYSGGTLNSKVWSSISGSPFTMVPLSEGQGRTTGAGIWMVASTSGGGSAIKLYHITDDLTGTPTMVYSSIPITAYTAPGTSLQKTTSATLMDGDSRMLSGFILDGIAHFVFHCKDANGTNTAINYCRLDVTAKTITSKLFGISGVDCAYPSIASYTADAVTNDKSVMIGFAESSSSMFPQVAVVNCDDGMNFGSATIVKASTTYVGSSGSQRWGDYSGISRRHNSPQACVWMAGSFGGTGNAWNAYVAQIYDAGFATGVTEPQKAAALELKAYPNPVVDRFTVEFTLQSDAQHTSIAVYDLQGKVVKDLYTGFCHEGENQFSFDKSNLSAGTYFLIIRTESNEVLHEKIVVAD